MADTDSMSELLVAQLLEEDLKNIHYGKFAEKLQLDLLLVDSSKGKGRHFQEYSKPQPLEDDYDIATQIFVEGFRSSSDHLCAQVLQHSIDASEVASQQLAQKLVAAEKNILLDAEFAKRLQDAEDNGQIATDNVKMLDAESVLGRDFIDSVMVSDVIGKDNKSKIPTPMSNIASKKVHNLKEPELSIISGKARQVEDYEGSEDFANSNLYPICGICLEPFQSTHSPLGASLSANSSSRLPFGLRLPCPNDHPYCISCLSHYIKSKLDPEQDGSINTTAIVFPIRCPECPRTEWEQGIPDDVAERLLDESAIVVWHHRKLLDSLPRSYCPNPRCSALVQIENDPEEPQASCPACKASICIPCRVLWHTGIDCEEYQSLPLDERSPEDRLALELAKVKNWRRCPNCQAIVELTQGCHHITCRCMKEFCFKCGSSWDTVHSRCTSNPPCAFWDENLLLDQRERNREARVEELERRALPGFAPVAPPPYALPVVDRGELDWLDDAGIVCGRHWFTREMLSTLTCGYCDNKLNSLADLQYHLSHVRYHPVYACCGRLFKRDVDFERHLNSYPRRFGDHVYQLQR